jgi:hypothetical protein
MQRIAKVMASSSLCPEAICTTGSGDDKKYLSIEVTVANCFLVVNQAVRWGMDPFAVAQSVSVVRGKLCYEGKLVAAVLDAKLGVRLVFEWDDKTGDAAGIIVSGTLPGETEPRVIKGTVGDWKTAGKGSPWTTPLACRRQLAYRGSREWARIHSPAIMLGVYTADEMEAIASDRRAAHFANEVQPPVDVTLATSRKLPPPPPPPGPPPVITSGKAPPPPPAEVSPPTERNPNAGGFDFEGLRKALREAQTEEAANDVYDRLVNQRSRHMTEAEIEECDNIAREAFAAFYPSPEE